MTAPRRTRAAPAAAPSALLRAHIAAQGDSIAGYARRLGASVRAVRQWLAEEKRPTPAWRAAIERDGGPKASAWLTDGERRALRLAAHTLLVRAGATD